MVPSLIGVVISRMLSLLWAFSANVDQKIVFDLRAVHGHFPAAVCPAHVGDRDKKRGWQPVHTGDLGFDDGRLPAKAHRTNPQGVGFTGQTLFQCRQIRVGIGRAQFIKQNFLRFVIGGAAVAANRHAQNSRRAALTLGFLDGIQHDLAHACQIAPRAETVIGQGVLRADILAAAAFEHQLDGQRVTFDFFKVDRWKFFAAQVVAAILVVNRIDGIGAHVIQPRGLFHGAADLRLKFECAPALGIVDIEDGRAGILADGRGLGAGEFDIFYDRFQRAAGGRAGGSLFQAQRADVLQHQAAGCSRCGGSIQGFHLSNLAWEPPYSSAYDNPEGGNLPLKK